VSLRRPVPGTFESLLEEIQVPVASLVRLSRFPKTELWWSHGRYRFDGPHGGSFGTCYAADRLDVAFCESVIHESSTYLGGKFVVPAADATSRHVVTLKRDAQPMLRLANLTGEALKKLGLNADISAGDDYRIPQAWADAIFSADSTWDGIQYVSRQNNAHTAVAIFERASDPAQLVEKKSARKLTKKQLGDLCDQFGVTLI
jgi:hypothetical protein